MKRAEVLQEIRMMRFEEAYYGWQEQRLTQDEAAYLPGVCERAFRTHQERLPKEPALAGISDMEEADRYVAEIYLPACNEEFAVSNDNCVSFEGLSRQIPPDKYRCHYVRVKVRVHRYPDGRLAIFHGPRKLAVHDAQGNLIDKKKTGRSLGSAARPCSGNPRLRYAPATISRTNGISGQIISTKTGQFICC